MKVKLKEILETTQQFQKLVEVDFPVAISYRLRRLVDKLNPIIASYNVKRDELIKKFGTKTKDGVYTVKDKDKLVKFREQEEILGEIEESIEFTPISIEELGDVKISPNLLVSWAFTD